jgi:PAS domain S-box-containing protein
MDNRDRVTGGTIVLRDRRVVYATVGAQALLGRSGRDLLGRGLEELLAPEDRERVLERLDRRLRGQPVPTEYDMQLLLPDGSQRTTEARVSLEGSEVVVQLQDLSEQAGRRRRLEGLAALGVAIHRERTEAAIQERVREGLQSLDLTPALLRPKGDGVQVVWARLPAAITGAVTALLNRPIEGLIGPWSSFSREVWSTGSAYSDDWVAHAALFARQGQADRMAAAAAALGLVRGLAVRLDERLGPTDYLVAAGEWIRSDDLPAFRLFGAQVAAALDSARDIADLSSRNVDMAALAELGALSGTAASLDEFLPRALEVVIASAGCQAAGVYAASPTRQQLELIHTTGLDGPLLDGVTRIDLDSPLGAVMDSRRLVVAHLDELDPEQRAWAETERLATFSYVPLVARTQTLGVMAVAWRERLDASACRPELLLAMGSHLAAAMESHDLLRDLRRRVGELTLLNDVAVATASLDPVLLLENALQRVCETFEADGGLAYLSVDGLLEQQAAFGLPAESAAMLKQLEPGEGPAGQAVAQRQPVIDLAPELAGPRCNETRLREGIRTLIAVPLLAKERAVGSLCLFRRTARPFAAGDVTLLSAIGVQLGVAVDAALQHADVRRRARDLEAIHALALRVLSAAPGETAALLQEATGAVASALSAGQVVIMLLDEGGTSLVPAAIHGPPVPEAFQRLPLARPSLAAEALRSGAPAWTGSTALDPRSAVFGREEVPALALLAVPLAARTTPRGVLLIADAPGHRFSEADRALASALGAELALALENAALYTSLHQEEEKNIRKSRLEALGELSAVIAHEVRNPLGVIFNSLGSLRRLTGTGGDARMLLDIVGEEADRLNRIVGDLLDFARHSPPQLAFDRLEQVVDEAVSVAVAQPPAGLEVVRKLGAALPEVAFDAGQVRQAVLNLVVNAVQAMPGGGRLTVRTYLEGSTAVVEVEDTGPGIAEVIRARIFEPFFTTKATGTGLGLPVVKRIVEGHGGELALRTGPAGTCFSLRFPNSHAPAGRSAPTSTGSDPGGARR